MYRSAADGPLSTNLGYLDAQLDALGADVEASLAPDSPELAKLTHAVRDELQAAESPKFMHGQPGGAQSFLRRSHDSAGGSSATGTSDYASPNTSPPPSPHAAAAAAARRQQEGGDDSFMRWATAGVASAFSATGGAEAEAEVSIDNVAAALKKAALKSGRDEQRAQLQTVLVLVLLVLVLVVVMLLVLLPLAPLLLLLLLLLLLVLVLPAAGAAGAAANQHW